MPRRAQGRSKSRSRGRKNPASRITPIDSLDITLSDKDETLACPEPASQRRRSNRLENRNQLSTALINIDVDLAVQDENHQSNSEPVALTNGSRGNTSGRRGNASRRSNTSRRNPRASRPVMVSLDVTYSSDEFEKLPSSPEKDPDNSFSFAVTPSPEPRDCAVESDAPDSSNESEEKKADDIGEEKKFEINFDSDEEEDLFFVDYKLKRDKALRAAVKEIQNLERDSANRGSEQNPSTKEDQSDSLISIAESLVPNVEEVTPKRTSWDLDLELDLEFIGSASKLSENKRMKKSKEITQAQKHLKQFSEELSKNQANVSLNEDIILTSDEEEEENITLFIKWESNYIRWPVRQFQKFSSVYKEVAERFNLNVAQVLLCHDDKIINHEVCSKDLNLKFGDIIECGVLSQPTLQVKGTVLKQSKDSIPLKVQNSERKGIVTIYIGRHAKMKELMHRYAEEKNLKVGNLHFRFDGETLDPSDTPETLDLEGNECIDVFNKLI